LEVTSGNVGASSPPSAVVDEVEEAAAAAATADDDDAAEATCEKRLFKTERRSAAKGTGRIPAEWGETAARERGRSLVWRVIG
jgi:hypothetical protein